MLKFRDLQFSTYGTKNVINYEKYEAKIDLNRNYKFWDRPNSVAALEGMSVWIRNVIHISVEIYSPEWRR